MRFVRVLGRGKRVFKDSVRLIARFYSRSEYDEPRLETNQREPQFALTYFHDFAADFNIVLFIILVLVIFHYRI